jgi:hypothetical protein
MWMLSIQTSTAELLAVVVIKVARRGNTRENWVEVCVPLSNVREVFRFLWTRISSQDAMISRSAKMQGRKHQITCKATGSLNANADHKQND